ncbi:MAG: ferritin [Gemmatimonadota bacterium]
MLKKTVLKALNDQVNAELHSAYLYLGMSAWCEGKNLPGFAGWLRKQFEEEQAHALKLYDYILDQGGAVTLTAVAAAPTSYKSLQDVWETTLKHEQHVTALIHKLYALAQKEQDFATQALMQWFVTEQVEEEKHAGAILEQVKMVGTNSSAVFFLDRHVEKSRED